MVVEIVAMMDLTVMMAEARIILEATVEEAMQIPVTCF